MAQHFVISDDELVHYGMPRRSGRYPWGSGNNPEQRGKSFLGYVDELKAKGLSEKEIAEGLGMSTTELRTRKTIANAERRLADQQMAQRLKAKGLSNVAIGERMGKNESSIRALLDPQLQVNANIVSETANMLKKQVGDKGMIDIGGGVESNLGISRTKLNVAASLLEDEGYGVHKVKVEQLGTGKFTTIKVLTPPGMTYAEIYKNIDNIKTITEYSEDGGRSFLGLEPIRSVDGKRVLIRYGDEGGEDKDGVVELRRGVDDISLGEARYAQVRIGVDGTHYLKGMAIYTDTLPKGIDLIYNTNKPKGTPPEDVFKKMTDDPDNPFGSVVRQQHHITEEGKTHPKAKQMLEMKQAGVDYKDIAERLGVPESQVRKSIAVKALNIVNEEGDWTTWSKSISSQVLSKQSPALAKKQLDLDRNLKLEEFNEISALTNPVVKKALLNAYANSLDSAVVDLKAAALPRQANKVLLPITSLKENEIYAPSFKNGETVALIRHPHGGTFEIPELRVNNKNREANSLIHDALDAVGIHPSVTKKLSGADFDGDTVLVIPNKRKDIKSSPALKEIENFDPKSYHVDGLPPMSNRSKQTQMGNVSNLITDMTIKGASVGEIARAVKHSMVVIDAQKHGLDYKQSAIDNGIAELKAKYQGGKNSGASTLISKASSEIRVNERKDNYKIDPNSGKKIYTETGTTYLNSKGKVITKKTKSTKIAEVEDAHKLSSGTKIETVYAEYANNLKALANKARKLMVHTPNLVYSPTAKHVYSKEVKSLQFKLKEANKNRPRERQAQLLANKIVRAKKDANPNMDGGDLKKIKGQALEEARRRVGAKKKDITITDKEWQAIQLGAISNNTLAQIIQNTKLESVKQKATPRTAYKMTDAKTARAKAMAASGYTTSEIASALGVSTTTIQTTIK